jgi:hypothetical protein
MDGSFPSLGLGVGAAPEPLLMARGQSRAPLILSYAPHAPFSQRGVGLAKLPSMGER